MSASDAATGRSRIVYRILLSDRIRKHVLRGDDGRKRCENVLCQPIPWMCFRERTDFPRKKLHTVIPNFQPLSDVPTVTFEIR